MARVLVIVPFPVDAGNLARREAQLRAVRLGEGIAFTYRPVRIAPANYVSAPDSLLADLGILEVGLAADRV